MSLLRRDPRTPHRRRVDAFLASVMPTEPLIGLHLGSGARSRQRGRFRPAEGQRWIDVDIQALGDVRADARWLPFSAGSVDAVRATECLYSTLDVFSVLRECRRVLRGSGALVVTCPTLLPYPIDPWDVLRLTPWGWIAALRTVGFHVEQVEEWRTGVGVLAR